MAEKIEFPQPHSHFLSERDLKYQNAVNEKYELQRQLDWMHCVSKTPRGPTVVQTIDTIMLSLK